MVKSIALQVLEAGESLPERSMYSILASSMSEMGELGQEVSINQSESYKEKGSDGVIGEAIDVILCMYDIIYKENKNITEEELNSYAMKKIQKWVDKTLEHYELREKE